MKFHILTLFPEMVQNGLNTSIIGRAVQKGLLSIDAVNIRDFTQDKHGKVDDYPYGGGAGMLMQAQPVYDAWSAVTGNANAGSVKEESSCTQEKMLQGEAHNLKKIRTLYMTPQGQPFNQKLARELAKEEELVFLCGHYEGIDERVLTEIVTDYVSIGDYVLTGGELPAMVMIDAISRLVPGVLNNEDSAETETFHKDLLEYPQYTRPEIWNGQKVPQILFSGNHRNITKWRLEQSEERTGRIRPDLYAKYMEKQQTIKALSRHKRNHIHLMELLDRGNGDIIAGSGENLLLYDRESEAWLLAAKSPEEGKMLLEKLPPRASLFLVNGKELAGLMRKNLDIDWEMECIQYCYTRKETLPVPYKEICRLRAEHLPYLAANYDADEEDYLAERLQAGSMYGAFDGEKLMGFIGMHSDGSMGMLYVEEHYRQRKIAISLESFLINRQLEWGFTPYCHVGTDNTASKALQEKLGLYASTEVVVWMGR